ncbi:MAG TPA: hypothetical protein V6D15_10180 [Oculatellaceae cyanobacterium]
MQTVNAMMSVSTAVYIDVISMCHNEVFFCLTSKSAIALFVKELS